MIAALAGTVRRARPADAASVIAVLDTARARSRAAGYDLWPLGSTAERLALDAGHTFLAVDRGGSAIGTITVERRDPLRADRADGVVAGYVHRVAVRGTGTGLGAWLLDRADRHVTGFGGDRLRLDRIEWDPPLRRYYERAGFRHRTAGRALSRYERLIGSP